MSVYYTVNNEIENRNRLMGVWMRDWCKEMYNRDWDFCISLTYKFPIIKSSLGRRNITEYVNQLNKIDNQIDGFVVDELDKNLISIHHHLVLKSDINERELQKITNKVWKNRGINEVKRYDINSEVSYCEYITKHIGKTKRNVWDIITNFKT